MAVIGSLAVSIVAKTDKFQKGTKRARMIASRFAGALGVLKAGAAATGAAVLALARSHDQLARSMNASLAIMDRVSIAMREDMTKAAIDVSRTTRFSASQAAEGYFFLASAGMDAEQSLAAMPQVAKFATAGNFDLALATDLATDAQSALGLSSKDAATNLENLTRVTDVLVKGNTLANTSAQQLSEAFTNKAGAALRLVNKDMEEGAAVLLAYADQGIKGAEAGTALGIVMRDLQTKALKNRAAFAAAGVTVFDSSGKMQKLADIIADVETKLDGMSDAQKKATLLQLGFSDKSVAFIQTLLGTSEKIRGYEESLRSAGGVTEEVAGKQLTTMEKAMGKLRAGWESIAAAMGPVVEVLADWVAGSGDMLQSMSTQSGFILSFADLLHDLRIGWLYVSRAIKGVATVAAMLLDVFAKLIEAATGSKTSFGRFTADLAQGLDAATQETTRQLNEALVAKTPSEKMESFLRKAKAEAAKAAEEVERVTQPKVGGAIANSTGGLFKKLTMGLSKGIGAVGGGLAAAEKAQNSAILGRALNQLTLGFAGTPGGMKGPEQKQLSQGLAGALQQGTQEARSASLRNFGKSDPAQKTAKNSDKQVELLGEVRDGISALGDVFGFNAKPLTGG